MENQMEKKVGITVYLSKQEKEAFKSLCKENDSDMAKTLASYAKKLIKDQTK